MQKEHHFPGFLLAIEGIDGAGKTTQSHMLQSYLQHRKHTVIRTKEPTMGQWGQQLRDSALTGRLSPEEEVEYFIRDRKEHVENIINPALLDGHVVIIDRYYFSNMAYQGARGLGPEKIMEMNEAFAPQPDLLIVLDIDPRIGLERIRTRGDRANHFEKTDTLKIAREIFKAIQKPYKREMDARDHVDQLRAAIVDEFNVAFTERIARADTTPAEKLNATLSLFGAEPLSPRKKNVQDGLGI